MSQSPELAGGEGFTFEGDAAAFYLTALLAEANAPGIDDRIVTRVSVQQRDFGEPLDDVIVDFEDIDKNSARLSLQVKRALIISQAATNQDFRDIIRDSWATFKKPNFRINVDRYGGAVGEISFAKERALKTLCDWARESLTVEHFDARFNPDGIASEVIKTVKNDIVALLEEVGKQSSCTNEEIHQFLAHLVLIQFDFLREGATDPSEAINRIRDCLAVEDVDKAPLVWSHIVRQARLSAGKAGEFNRSRLVRSISSVARIRGGISCIHDLRKLSELASSYANLIPDDIGGTLLERHTLIEELDAKLTNARVVQVRGLPGNGKSVVVKRMVQRALQRGSVLFLKAEQLEGTSWISFATSLGLSGLPITQLLVEIGASGTPIFFIDAIDRIDKEHQPIILDVLRTITESPLLDNWRIVVSLRDTGIELLRNWLGDFLNKVVVETINVKQLNDDEAETLANAKPHLRSLLFGTNKVQEIVRRPFFIKVLDQNFVVDRTSAPFIPQSEVDLIENWWRRGGYDATGQSVIERQQVLLDLARIRAMQLNQPIRISQLSSIAQIDNLRSDGILQNAREGVSVRFAHDIFFEWAFFYILADRGIEWIAEIRSCGEPPAIARVVELMSQWEYAARENWSTYLTRTEDSTLRSQWLRAWLVGPFGTSAFEADEVQFATAVFANDFRLFRKVLVWFQAEKTAPNPNILIGSPLIPQDQRQQYAYLLGWPSDFAIWRRLINFILSRISTIPERLYPEIVSIFEVWQNALFEIPTPTSLALIKLCADWLDDIDSNEETRTTSDDNHNWQNVSDLKAFKKSLVQLVLRSSKADPSFATAYLQRVTSGEGIDENVFHDIMAFSPVLAQILPLPLVRVALAFLQNELPVARVEREKQEHTRSIEWRNEILAKPETERTRQEQILLSHVPSLGSIGNLGFHDWESLSINDDYRSFWPPSPLREPFNSLFQYAPDEALLLLRGLCNHAMSAWRQLHRYSYDRRATPIPLELTLPWGVQEFWGNEREYLWFRSTWAPQVIGCGFMALEEWCFSQLANNRPVDELIQQIIYGNECIAILGIAGLVALHTETVSEVTLPLFTSQRLLMADQNRWMQDRSPSNLIGFTNVKDKSHFDAVQTANVRSVRQTQLSWMVPRFIFFATDSIRERARNIILDFVNNLPFEYEEHRNIPEAQEDLRARAIKFAELAETKNYQVYRTKETPDQIEIVHTSPSAAEPENIMKAKEASNWINQNNLWGWAAEYFDKKILGNYFTIPKAITFAKEADFGNLYKYDKDANDQEMGIRRGAVAATAALVLNFREGCSQEDFDWARDVLKRAGSLPDKNDNSCSSSSVIPWHPSIYVVRGLAADIAHNVEVDSTDLLRLIAHPLQHVSLIALKEVCGLWSKNPRLTWAGLFLAFLLCHVQRRSQDSKRQYGEPLKPSDETLAAIDEALKFYQNDSEWVGLTLPPAAWVKIPDPSKSRRTIEQKISQIYHQRLGTPHFDRPASPADEWNEPKLFWDNKLAAKILELIPIDDILKSTAKNLQIEFLAGLLDWLNEKKEPHWADDDYLRQDHPTTRFFELTLALGNILGQLGGLIQNNDFQERFLTPILRLNSKNCWKLLSPFTHTYVCMFVYDSATMPPNAITILNLCLDRLFLDDEFNRDRYRSGEFSGYELPKIIHTLMFVSVDHASMAARYVNGNWSEIEQIMPIIDRFIRASGWAFLVMDSFLKLCGKAKANYPAEAFADQILTVVENGSESLKSWQGTLIPAKIAELIQYFSHVNSPMTSGLAQKFLRILDLLVDMGDRRSAALQLGEAFREIRLPVL